jgi:hypothetical protein
MPACRFLCDVYCVIFALLHQGITAIPVSGFLSYFQYMFPVTLSAVSMWHALGELLGLQNFFVIDLIFSMIQIFGLDYVRFCHQNIAARTAIY